MSSVTDEPDLDEESRRLESQLLDGVQRTGKNAEQLAAAQLEHYDLENRLAALMVRRKTRQHECQRVNGGPCAHPDHRRDVDYTLTMLEVLGLPTEYPVITDEERAGYGQVVAQALPHHGGKQPKPKSDWNGGKPRI